MKRVLPVLLVIILAFTAAGLAAGEVYSARQVEYCEEFVSLREEPSTSSKVLSEVEVGEVVAACKYNDRFSHCYHNGKSGYILNKYLRNEISPWSEPYEFHIGNCKEFVSLRALPKAGSEVLDKLPLDTPVTVVFHDNTYDPEAFVYVISETKGGGFVRWKYLYRPYSKDSQ